MLQKSSQGEIKSQTSNWNEQNSDVPAPVSYANYWMLRFPYTSLWSNKSFVEFCFAWAFVQETDEDRVRDGDFSLQKYLVKVLVHNKAEFVQLFMEKVNVNAFINETRLIDLYQQVSIPPSSTAISCL